MHVNRWHCGLWQLSWLMAPPPLAEVGSFDDGRWGLKCTGLTCVMREDERGKLSHSSVAGCLGVKRQAQTFSLTCRPNLWLAQSALQARGRDVSYTPTNFHCDGAHYLKTFKKAGKVWLSSITFLLLAPLQFQYSVKHIILLRQSLSIENPLHCLSCYWGNLF